MVKDFYDVIVVGAGPAGSVAARFAAEQGASVLLLERDREPGIPVRCAEGVSHNGIIPFIEIDSRWIASTINVARLQSPDGNVAFMYNNGVGYVLERRIFDAALAEKACNSGVHLLTKADATGLLFDQGKIAGVKFSHQGIENTVKCRIVIGADGVESRVGRWAGLKTAVRLEDIDTCVQYTLAGIQIQADTCEFYFGNKIAPGGYIWVFPKASDKANVGIGVSGHRTQNKGPKEYLDDFVQQRFPQGQAVYTVYGGVPTAATLREIVTDNLMLVGDAARQVNPITGGGIVQAMIAASLAGKVAAEACQKDRTDKKFLSSYPKEWNKKLGHSQQVMHKLKSRFLNMPDRKFNDIVNFCKRIPKEKFTLGELFKEAIKEDPQLVMEIATSFVITKLK